MRVNGGALLQAVATRIIGRYLLEAGANGVLRVDGDADPLRMSGVDLVCNRAGNSVRIKIKADPYFGTDPRKIADHELVFYRSAVNRYAFETISHHLTRDPGWMVSSSADEIYYYFLALDQTEDEVAALMEAPDDVFFSDLSVERDDLHILPMAALRAWFEVNGDAYTPRPVKLGDHSGWYRIVPVADIDRVVPGVSEKGSIFSQLPRF